jgi:hypothetical protein
MIEKYQPSSGCEGADFINEFCSNCVHMGPQDETGCQILAKTFRYSVEDEEYPNEWQIKDGRAVCVAFEKEKNNEI